MQRILIGYDGAEPSVRELEFVIEILLGEATAPQSTKIHLAYILEEPAGLADPIPEEVMDSLRRTGEEILLSGARTVKEKFGKPFTHLESGPAPQKLLELAERLKPDLIVLGIAKHSTSEKMLGTVSAPFKARKYPVLGVP
ncbi:MAG: universal stress protein [Nitrososphaerales archaeon]